MKEQIENGEKLIAGWPEEKPWITEEEAKGATDKVGVGGCGDSLLVDVVVCLDRMNLLYASFGSVGTADK